MKPAFKTARIKTKQSERSENKLKVKRKESEKSGKSKKTSYPKNLDPHRPSNGEVLYPEVPEKLEINI